ncbi:MAG: phosphoribosyltransferase [Pseudomonadota bacterium]
MTSPTGRYELMSWSRFADLSRVLAEKIRVSGYRPDMIVAIARGGVVPARVLCDYLDVMDLACVRVEHYRARRQAPEARVKHPLNASVDGLRLLVVDDVSDTGDSFIAALDHIGAIGHPSEVRTCAVQHKSVSKFVPDYYANEITEWRWVTYPWAVVEDLGEWIVAEGLERVDPEVIARVLWQRHEVEATREQIEDALHGLRFGA